MFRTHGHAPKTGISPTYISWMNMKARCSYKRDRCWSAYGGRGITVCDRWRDSFENFIADMGERPAGTTLDRIDNDGNYEPGNCRWASRVVQRHNSSTMKLTPDIVQEIHGRCEHGEAQISVARRFGISQQTVSEVRTGRTWAAHLVGWP